VNCNREGRSSQSLCSWYAKTYIRTRNRVTVATAFLWNSCVLLNWVQWRCDNKYGVCASGRISHKVIHTIEIWGCHGPTGVWRLPHTPMIQIVVFDQYPDDVGSRFSCSGRAHLPVFTKDVHVQKCDGRPL